MKALNTGYRPTPVSLALNPYFNLRGGEDENRVDGKDESVSNHQLRIFAHMMLPTSDSGDGTTKGEMIAVRTSSTNKKESGTQSNVEESETNNALSALHSWDTNDENSGVMIGERLDAIRAAQPFWPYGDCYVLEHHEEIRSPALESIAREDLTYFSAELKDATSGRRMRILTTEPCLQLHYDQHRSGIALRPQRFPDCLPGTTNIVDESDLEAHEVEKNQENADTASGASASASENPERRAYIERFSDQCVLQPGKTYIQRSVYVFDTDA